MSTSKYEDVALKLFVKELMNEMRDEIRENLVDEIDQKLSSQKSDINHRLQRLENSKEVMEQNMEKFSDNLQLLEKNTNELDNRMKKQNNNTPEKVQKFEDFDFESTGSKLRNVRRSIGWDVADGHIIEDELEQDVFSFMMLNPSLSKTWFLGLISFALQSTLGLMVVLDLTQKEFWELPLNIPIRATIQVHITQFIVIILAIMTQTDVLIGIRMILIFPLQNQNTWKDFINAERNFYGDEPGNRYWYLHVLLPNVLKLIEGSLILMATFIIIIQTESVVDLLKDYTALFVISSIDNIMFALADEGYFGKECFYATTQVKEKRLRCYKKDVKWSLISVFVLIILIMLIPWAYFTSGQVDGRYIIRKYPLCPVTNQIEVDGENKTFEDLISDGNCQSIKGEGTNIRECGWDGGDCPDFNEYFNLCKVDDPSKLNDGNCNSEEEMYNSIYCGYDNNDCIEHNKNKYKEVGVDNECNAGFPDKLNDDNCDLENNNENCNYDAGDCDWFNEEYPSCVVEEPSLIGDRSCNGGEYNVRACGWDGGDCMNEVFPECHVDDPREIGNGKCKDQYPYNTIECGTDGGDCVVDNYPKCHVEHPEWINDTLCLPAPYNTEDCGWDGGDCLEFNEKYPNCTVDKPYWVGNNVCSGPLYNVEECGFDGGDCG